MPHLDPGLLLGCRRVETNTGPLGTAELFRSVSDEDFAMQEDATLA